MWHNALLRTLKNRPALYILAGILVIIALIAMFNWELAIMAGILVTGFCVICTIISAFTALIFWAVKDRLNASDMRIAVSFNVTLMIISIVCIVLFMATPSEAHIMQTLNIIQIGCIIFATFYGWRLSTPNVDSEPLADTL